MTEINEGVATRCECGGGYGVDLNRALGAAADLDGRRALYEESGVKRGMCDEDRDGGGDGDDGGSGGGFDRGGRGNAGDGEEAEERGGDLTGDGNAKELG